MAARISDRRLLYTLLAIFLSIVMVSLAGILYTGYVNSRNDRRWCEAFISIDDAYEQARSNPNITPAGKRIADAFHKLRVEFGC